MRRMGEVREESKSSASESSRERLRQKRREEERRVARIGRRGGEVLVVRWRIRGVRWYCDCGCCGSAWLVSCSIISTLAFMLGLKADEIHVEECCDCMCGAMAGVATRVGDS